MKRDPFYQQIIERLKGPLDPNSFEECCADILRADFPALVPVRGVSDAGMDGAIADGTGLPFPLICTTGKNVIGNLTKNITSYVENGGERRKAVFATSQELTRKKRKNLEDRAKELGFALVQTYSQSAIAETQDNMIEWEGTTDLATGLPVYSLYGKNRKPLPGMLENLDALVVEMQDAGARYYTFIWTMALVMEACQEQSKAGVVLDRPNPIGGEIIEGPVLQPEFASFVGLRSLPVRHGMTIAEVALYLKEAYNTGLAMYIVTMEGWKRRMWFEETGLPWVFPSPNMPTVETAAVYPGMCLLEATNFSEGRGTTRPFEIFGDPFIEPATLPQARGTSPSPVEPMYKTSPSANPSQATSLVLPVLRARLFMYVVIAAGS